MALKLRRTQRQWFRVVHVGSGEELWIQVAAIRSTPEGTEATFLFLDDDRNFEISRPFKLIAETGRKRPLPELSPEGPGDPTRRP